MRTCLSLSLCPRDSLLPRARCRRGGLSGREPFAGKEAARGGALAPRRRSRAAGVAASHWRLSSSLAEASQGRGRGLCVGPLARRGFLRCALTRRPAQTPDVSQGFFSPGRSLLPRRKHSAAPAGPGCGCDRPSAGRPLSSSSSHHKLVHRKRCGCDGRRGPELLRSLTACVRLAGTARASSRASRLAAFNSGAHLSACPSHGGPELHHVGPGPGPSGQ